MVELTAARQKAMLEQLRQQGDVTVQDLAGRFGVSLTTIRRDLDVLSQSGQVQRVHGGAVLPQPTVAYEPRYDEKARLHHEEKARIGAAAADLVEDGATIILDSASTSYQVARHLLSRQGITVITNDLHIATLLGSQPDISVFMVGGRVRPNQFCCLGMHAERCLADLNADMLFLAVDGVDLTKGATNAAADEVPVKQAMIRSARRTFLIADHSKFGRVAMVTIVPLARVDHIITDKALPEAWQRQLADIDVRLTLA